MERDAWSVDCDGAEAHTFHRVSLTRHGDLGWHLKVEALANGEAVDTLVSVMLSPSEMQAVVAMRDLQNGGF